MSNLFSGSLVMIWCKPCGRCQLCAWAAWTIRIFESLRYYPVISQVQTKLLKADGMSADIARGFIVNIPRIQDINQNDWV